MPEPVVPLRSQDAHLGRHRHLDEVVVHGPQLDDDRDPVQGRESPDAALEGPAERRITARRAEFEPVLQPELAGRGVAGPPDAEGARHIRAIEGDHSAKVGDARGACPPKGTIGRLIATGMMPALDMYPEVKMSGTPDPSVRTTLPISPVSPVSPVSPISPISPVSIRRGSGSSSASCVSWLHNGQRAADSETRSPQPEQRSSIGSTVRHGPSYVTGRWRSAVTSAVVRCLSQLRVRSEAADRRWDPGNSGYFSVPVGGRATDDRGVDVKHEVITVGDAAVLASRAAALVAERGGRAIEAGGRFTLPVQRGGRPVAMFAELAGVVGPDFDWASVQVFQVDERVAPDGDPDRNLTHLRESLRGVPAEIVPMPVNDDDLDAAAPHVRGPAAGPLRPGPPRARPRRPHCVPGPGGSRARGHRPAGGVTQPYQGHRRMTLPTPPWPGPTRSCG